MKAYASLETFGVCIYKIKFINISFHRFYAYNKYTR